MERFKLLKGRSEDSSPFLAFGCSSWPRRTHRLKGEQVRSWVNAPESHSEILRYRPDIPQRSQSLPTDDLLVPSTEMSAPTPKGSTVYPIGDLTPDDFEAMTYLLVRGEFEDAVHIRPKDQGLDVRLPDARGNTIRGWQAKRFSTDGINWDQCVDSATRATTFWQPPRITFVFPKDLSATEQETFKRRLCDPHRPVRLDWWGNTEVQRRLRDTPDGQRAAKYLFENHEQTAEQIRRIVEAGGELRDGEHAAVRIAAVQKFLDEDPHYKFRTQTAGPDSELTSPSHDVVASAEMDMDGTKVRFDAMERYTGAAENSGMGLNLNFAEDDDGIRAREAVDRVVREGGQVEISKGVTGEFFGTPAGLRGLAPEGPVSGTFRIGALESVERPRRPGLLLRCGEYRIAMTPDELDSKADPEIAWRGGCGGLSLVVRRKVSNDEISYPTDLNWKAGQGSASSQLASAKLFGETLRGFELEITTIDESLVLAKLSSTANPVAATLEAFDETLDFLGLCAEVEAWLGFLLEPPANPTVHDASVLARLITRIRATGNGKFGTIKSILTKPLPEMDDVFQIAVTSAYRDELFGQERYLGMEFIHIDRARLVDATGSEGPGDEITIGPADDATSIFEFYPPSQVPEDAGLPQIPRNG